MGPQENDSHVEIQQVTLGIVFSRRLHLALALGEQEYLTRYSAYTRKGEPCIWDKQHSFFLFLFFFLFGRSGHFYSRVSRVSNCVRVQAGILEFYCLGPLAWMWIDMAWTWIRSGRSSSSISFLPLRGWKLLFLFLFFFFRMGEKVLNTGVGFVVFFSHISR